MSSRHRANRKGETVASDGTIILGGARVPLVRNLYHRFLEVHWSVALGAIVAAFLAINLVYGTLYFLIGGIVNARPGSFLDAFMFSVETAATIGYGNMVPQSTAANLLVATEAIVGLLMTAVTTGLVFAKFTLSPAMIDFARNVVIAPMNGVPTLMIRLGNLRDSAIVEATARVMMFRTEVTSEGVVWYRTLDLPLTRERTAALSRSWNILHTIDERSPLHGTDAASLERDEIEIIVSVAGIDETSMQPVHARKRYVDKEILFGVRYADVMSTREDGTLVLDIRRFHDVVPLDRDAER
jgi:inward rectifier potassium channel